MVKRQPQTQDKYIVRMPAGMRERIESAAAQGGRSMNAEIVLRLTKSFEDDERATAFKSKGFLHQLGEQSRNSVNARLSNLAAQVDMINQRLAKAGL